MQSAVLPDAGVNAVSSWEDEADEARDPIKDVLSKRVERLEPYGEREETRRSLRLQPGSGDVSPVSG